MAFWHRAHLDKCLFQLHILGPLFHYDCFLTSVPLLESKSGFEIATQLGENHKNNHLHNYSLWITRTNKYFFTLYLSFIGRSPNLRKLDISLLILENADFKSVNKTSPAILWKHTFTRVCPRIRNCPQNAATVIYIIFMQSKVRSITATSIWAIFIPCWMPISHQRAVRQRLYGTPTLLIFCVTSTDRELCPRLVFIQAWNATAGRGGHPRTSFLDDGTTNVNVIIVYFCTGMSWGEVSWLDLTSERTGQLGRDGRVNPSFPSYFTCNK